MSKRTALPILVLSALLALSVRCLALDVLVNQAAYEANAPKIVRVQRATDYAGDGTFTVRKVSDGSTLYSGTLTRKGGLWSKYYWEGDFSSCRSGGGSEVYIAASVDGEIGNSFNFTIGQDSLLDKTGKLVYQYFQAQRCGTAVSFKYVDRNGNPDAIWSHNACHLDDGYLNPGGPNIDATGGWHDAGDYGKYGHGFAGNPVSDLITLYEANRAYYDAIDSNSNGLADIIDEALWQAHWLVKMVDGNGHVREELRQRRTGASWVKPENDTNNIPGTSDDRWVDVGDESTPQETVVCAALIRMHRLLASKSLPTENFADKALAIWNHKVAVATSEGHNNLGSGAHHIWAGLDLYAVFGQQNCWDRAVQRLDEMATNAINNPAMYDVHAEPAGYELGVMAWFARSYPSVPQAATARTAVQALMAHYLTLADDPIGLIRRDEGGTLQYLPTVASLGYNRLYGLVAWAAIEAYKINPDPAYLRFALDQVNWILGSNYHRVCMMEAAGDYHLNKYHSRYDTIVPNGIEPGIVTNGYIRDSNNLPWVDFGTGSVSVQTNESWLPNSSAYAMALAGMTVFRNSAQMVSNTIPSSMYAGQTVTATVGVKNTGWIPWTQAAEFKLGGVGDSDPFAPTRVNFGGSDSIGNNQQKAFSFSMTAPSTPGTYTTDWQMVQEGVNWFGDTLTKPVQVVPAGTPPGPVTGFTATYGDQQVSLAWTNPGDGFFASTMIRYKTTGYPTSTSDGTLVVDKTAGYGTSDSYVHSGLTNGVAYYYRAFSRGTTGVYSTTPWVMASATPAFVAIWMNQTFETFANGNLGGQGAWTATATDGQVQSSVNPSGSTKSVLLDAVAAGGTITNNYSDFTKKTAGSQAISFDAAQSWSGTSSTTIFGSVSIYGDDSGTEIARFGATSGQWRLEYGNGNVSVLDSSVAQNTWCTIKLVLDLSQRKISAYVNGVSKASNLSFKTNSGTNIARISLSSTQVAGLTAQKLYLDNIKGETLPFAPASVTDDGAYTGSLSKLHCSWASGGSSCIEYKYAIGTAVGGTNVVGWTTVGGSTEITRQDLTLEANRTYYFAVQAGNGIGSWSSSTNSNGIKTPTTALTILGAKALADGSIATDNRAIRGRVVSAAFPGYFYVQEPNGYYGLKTVSAAAVSPGVIVDLAGLMKGSGAERYIDCTGNAIGVTTPAPLSPPDPVCLGSASVGGASLNSYTLGVVGGIGPNDMGLLVTVCGRVTQRDTLGLSYFYIDDGCRLSDGTTTSGVQNVGLRIVGNPTSYSTGSYVTAKGVVSCFSSGGLRPQILPVAVQVVKGP